MRRTTIGRTKTAGGQSKTTIGRTKTTIGRKLVLIRKTESSQAFPCEKLVHEFSLFSAYGVVKNSGN